MVKVNVWCSTSNLSYFRSNHQCFAFVIWRGFHNSNRMDVLEKTLGGPVICRCPLFVTNIWIKEIHQALSAEQTHYSINLCKLHPQSVWLTFSFRCIKNSSLHLLWSASFSCLKTYVVRSFEYSLDFLTYMAALSPFGTWLLPCLVQLKWQTRDKLFKRAMMTTCLSLPLMLFSQLFVAFKKLPQVFGFWHGIWQFLHHL